jgi:hypothetical protein
MLVPEADKPLLAVPATAIYTRSDGVVRWWTCLEAEGPTRENIEVRGSHSGLGFNIAGVVAISDRLAQADGTWTPFESPPALRWLFPAPSPSVTVPR